MSYELLCGDVLAILPTLPANSVQCVVTSPPYYGLRDYGVNGQIGLEESPEQYVEKLVQVFREVRRVLRADGTLWMNLGDSYNSQASNQQGKRMYNGDDPYTALGRSNRRIDGLKTKDLIGIPWRVAFALQADGWYLRSDIIWSKPNPMPESVTDRPTKAHEYLFLLSQSERYYYDAEAIKEPAAGEIANGFRGGAYCNGSTIDNSVGGNRKISGNHRIENATRNKRTVWAIATEAYPEAHFATYPTKLVEPCILAGSKPGDRVLDPFNGSGTTGFASVTHGRNYTGIDINPAYIALAHKRIGKAAYQAPLFANQP